MLTFKQFLTREHAADVVSRASGVLAPALGEDILSYADRYALILKMLKAIPRVKVRRTFTDMDHMWTVTPEGGDEEAVFEADLDAGGEDHGRFSLQKKPNPRDTGAAVGKFSGTKLLHDSLEHLKAWCAHQNGQPESRGV